MQDIEKYIVENYCGGAAFYDPSDAYNTLISSVSESFQPALSTFFMLLCLSVLAAVIKAFSDALSDDGGAADLCVSLVVALTVYETVKYAYAAVNTALTGIAVLMDSMTGVMAVMYGLTGNIVGGSSSVTVLMLVLQIIRVVNDKILMPLILVCFGVSVVSGFGFNFGLNEFGRVVKRAVTVLCALSGAVVCAVLVYQSVISRSADNAALRSVRFASASFVPIVGSALSESAATVISALSAVRSAAGIGGVIAVLAAVIPSVVTVVFCKLCMYASSFICRTLGVEKTAGFFDDCSHILSMLLSVDITVSLIFIVACSIFSL